MTQGINGGKTAERVNVKLETLRFFSLNAFVSIPMLAIQSKMKKKSAGKEK